MNQRVSSGARLALLMLALPMGLAACGSPTGPAAWDKSLVARPEMSMSWNPLASRFEQHIYESKEAAAGGYGVGGGGCGCN